MRDFIAMSTAMAVKVFSISVDPASIAGVGGIITFIFTSVFAIYKYRQAQKGKEAEAHEAALDRKAVLDKQIDDRIASQLESAWAKIAELEKKIEGLITSESKTRQENTQLKQVVKWWFQDLQFWDRGGRSGGMPLPSEENMAMLELSYNEDTNSLAELRRLRASLDGNRKDS